MTTFAKVKVANTPEGIRYRFYCPGCKSWHVISDSWEFNKDVVQPTFSPSILVTLPEGTRERADPQYLDTLPPDRCHSFVRDGRIEFLSDCTHALAGQTVDLPEIDANLHAED